MATISGRAGSDTLLGTGPDTLAGLGGDDTYVIYDPRAVVEERSQAGTDAVYTFASYALTSDSSVELLTTAQNAATTALDLTGSSVAQVIVGNYGNNVLDGRGGGDTIYGLLGDD